MDTCKSLRSHMTDQQTFHFLSVALAQQCSQDLDQQCLPGTGFSLVDAHVDCCSLNDFHTAHYVAH